MKKIRIVILSILMLLGGFITFDVIDVRAAENTSVVTGVDTNAVNEDVYYPMRDVIVKKFRVSYGQLQYRRWNETRGYWVDPYWINF